MPENTLKDISVTFKNTKIPANFKPGNPIVIFSHGFAIEKTSMGMFTDIAGCLPDGTGYILFDYYDMDGDDWYIPSIATMVSKLKTVIDYVKTVSENVTLIGHSQGCTIIALLEDPSMPTIFLAPPTRDIYTNWKELFVSKRKDRASILDNGDVKLVRKRDQKTLTVSNDWFEELVGNPSFKNMLEIAKTGNLTVIEALEDEDIKDRRRYKKLETTGADIHKINADHNFTGDARNELTKLISNLIV